MIDSTTSSRVSSIVAGDDIVADCPDQQLMCGWIEMNSHVK